MTTLESLFPIPSYLPVKSANNTFTGNNTFTNSSTFTGGAVSSFFSTPYVLPGAGQSSAAWYILGRLTNVGSGNTMRIEVQGGSNLDTSGVTAGREIIEIKSGNNTGSGPNVLAIYYRLGLSYGRALTAVKLVSVNATALDNAYDIWIQVNPNTDSSKVLIYGDGLTFTYNGANQPSGDPGPAGTTIAVATNIFSVVSSTVNMSGRLLVGPVTDNTTSFLQVNGNSTFVGAVTITGNSALNSVTVNNGLSITGGTFASSVTSNFTSTVNFPSAGINIGPNGILLSEDGVTAGKFTIRHGTASAYKFTSFDPAGNILPSGWVSLANAQFLAKWAGGGYINSNAGGSTVQIGTTAASTIPLQILNSSGTNIWQVDATGAVTQAASLTVNSLGSFTTSGSTGTLVITDTGTNGANLSLRGNGSTTPNKVLRAAGGNLEFVNSAYSAVIATLYDNGTLATGGAWIPTGYIGYNTTGGSGAGGAGIWNDSGTYKTLMILGNSSAGGTRQVTIWDTLTVQTGGLVVNGPVSVPGSDLTVGSNNRSIAGAFQSSNTGMAPNSNPTTAAFRSSGNFGGGIGFVDGAFGLTMYSNSGNMTFGFGSNSSVTAKCTINSDGSFTGTNFTISSDKRIKTWIRDLEGEQELEEFMQLQGRFYLKAGKQEFGFYAQDFLNTRYRSLVQVKASPDGKTSDFHYFDINGLHAPHIAVTQALYRKIKQLEQRVADLER